MVMKVGIIGFGSMGSMIARKFLEHGVVNQSELICSNRTLFKMDEFKNTYPECTVTSDNQLAAKSDVVFVCIRPVELKEVLCGIAPVVSDDTLVVSLNGSVMFSQLESVLPEKTRIAKVIPSVNAEVDYSVTSFCCNEYVQEKDRQNLETLLKSFGTVTEVAEKELGMASELTSCMPGFIAAIFSVLAEKARAHTDMSPAQIEAMLSQTLEGTGRLINQKQLSFAQVLERVATKGGITEVGASQIFDGFGDVAAAVFDKTLEKRRITTQKAKESF
ncbi:MAG: NAD(P)-binding domain-containing protein [Treponema sp.]|nr:NAD(P)-binding domain-containing protein [Treponema sp.]